MSDNLGVHMRLKKIFSALLTVAMSTAITGSLLAGPFTISNVQYPSQATLGLTGQDALYATVVAEINKQVVEMEKKINDQLPDVDASKYLKGMANSAAISTKGAGVDYATNMDIFLVGIGAGVGLDTGGSSFDNLENAAGIGINMSLMAGLNLGLFQLGEVGPINLDKIDVYLNFFSADIPDVEDNIKGKFTSFGLHAQYKIIDPKNIGFGALAWRGVDLTTGFDYNSLKLTVTETFNEDLGQSTITLNDTGTPATSLYADVDQKFTGNAELGADIGVFTMPVEVSTAGRLLWFLTGFVGLGADFTLGSASNISNVTGQIVGDAAVKNGTGVQSGTDKVSADAKLDLGDKQGPSFLGLRGFVGMQIEMGVVFIYAQLNKGLTNDTIGANFGVRAGW